MASQELIDSANEWVAWDPDHQSRLKVHNLLHNQDYATLSEMFEPRITLGSEGFVGKMDAGYSNMNQLVSVQISQGLAMYLLYHLDEAKERGVIIGCDSRHNSRIYANLAGHVFKSLGFKVYIYTSYIPSSIIAFGVRNKNAAAGIMFTASNEPKEMNGCKIYLSDGAPVSAPADKDIIRAINLNLEPWHKYDGHAYLPDVIDNPYDIMNEYYQTITTKYCYHKAEFRDSSFHATYTPLQGIGAGFVTRPFTTFGLPYSIPVSSQEYPNPDFSTVTAPNPANSVNAFAQSILTAENENSSLIFASDSDAGRLGVAVRDPTTLDWVYLSGNEIGSLFAEWTWLKWREANPNGDASKCVMISSTDSSNYLKTMADTEGFEYRESEPGFNLIAQEAVKATEDGYTCLLAYDVDLGFMIGDTVFDRDGVSAPAVLYEAACYWESQGETLLDRITNFNNTY